MKSNYLVNNEKISNQYFNDSFKEILDGAIVESQKKELFLTTLIVQLDNYETIVLEVDKFSNDLNLLISQVCFYAANVAKMQEKVLAVYVVQLSKLLSLPEGEIFDPGKEYDYKLNFMLIGKTNDGRINMAFAPVNPDKTLNLDQLVVSYFNDSKVEFTTNNSIDIDGIKQEDFIVSPFIENFYTAYFDALKIKSSQVN